MSTETTTKCDHCGKIEDEFAQHIQIKVWRTSGPNENLDACSEVCARMVHAKLAQIPFDTKKLEEEHFALLRKIDRPQSDKERTDLDRQISENAALSRKNWELEEEVKQLRKLDRTELAYLLEELVRRINRGFSDNGTPNQSTATREPEC